MNFSHKALGLTLTALLLVPFFSQVGAAQTPKKAAPSAVKVGTAKKDPSMTLDFTKEDAAKKIILRQKRSMIILKRIQIRTLRIESREKW